MVTISTRAARRSARVWAISSPVSPSPSMIPDLVSRSGASSLARRSTASERGYWALRRTRRVSRSTVSMLWLRMFGPARSTFWSESSTPSKSGISTSMVMPGLASRTLRMVAAKTIEPPSERSSRLTEVITTCLRPICWVARATRCGSWMSRPLGLPLVTAQKPQARVQMSPRIIKVAVRCSQHSPMFGQRASSHTVCSSRSRMIVFSST